MLSLLANWRLILAGSLIAAALAGWAYVSHLQRAADNAKAQAASATRQASTDRATVQAVDHFTTEVRIIREKADHAEQQIRSAPTAGEELDPGFRDALCDALGGLRGSPVCTDDNGPEHVAGDLQGSGEPPAN